MVELSAHGYFQYDVDVFLVLEAAVHLDDVGVVEEDLYFDLADELVDYLLLDEHCLFDYLQGADETAVFLTGLGESYRARNTLPYLPWPTFRIS